ncbi:MAG: hypothetical protein IJR14_08230 [Synergistaceae bacterium]|nr:hypothetical protein [Synergistaceae bacterium]
MISPRRLLLFPIVLLLALLIPALALAAPRYIASRKQKAFHVVTCPWAQRIEKRNAVYYASREDAIRDGRRPCKECEP